MLNDRRDLAKDIVVSIGCSTADTVEVIFDLAPLYIPFAKPLPKSNRLLHKFTNKFEFSIWLLRAYSKAAVAILVTAGAKVGDSCLSEICRLADSLYT